MIEHKVSAQPSTAKCPWTSSAAWLRSKLAPHDNNLMHWVVYVMIVGAMALFVIWQRDLPTWRFAGTLAALSALLMINTLASADATGFCDNKPDT